MNLRKINTTSMRIMRYISGFTYLLIGIDWRHNRYYVVNSRTGEKYHLLAGVLCSFIGSMITVLGGLAFVVLPVGILESSPVIDWPVIVRVLRAIVGTATVAYAGNRLDSIFTKRPDLYDEDFMPTQEWLEKWVY